MSMLAPLGDVLSGHPYLYAFIALLFAGESVLLPVIFLALRGSLDLGAVFLIGVAATLVSDSFWYWLGRKFPPSVYARFTGRRTEKVMLRLESLFTTKGTQMLVLSKFVYGTRIAAQMLSGIHGMPFVKYTASNCLGVILLMSTLVALGYFAGGTAEQLGTVTHTASVAFLAFIVLAVGAHLVIGGIIKKKWFQ